MDYQELIDSLSPDVVARLRRAVETGRWPDGRALTQEQKEHSLRAVIAWDQQHLPADQRVGFIDTSGLRKGNSPGGTDATQQTLRWTDRSETPE